jgi:hypothetical protein
MKSINLIDCVSVRLQSVMTYIYIVIKTWLFESDTTKYFLNKLNLNPYSNSICSGKTVFSGIQNG